MALNNDKLFEEILLEKFEIGVSKEIGKASLLLNSEIYIEDLSRNLGRSIVVQLRGFLWSEKLKSSFVRYPSDWWEHFKQRWFPNFLLKKYPVKETVHEFSASIVYPDYKPSIPNERHILKVAVKNPFYEHKYCK